MKAVSLAATLIMLIFSSQASADPAILAKWAQLIPTSDDSSTPTISVRIVLNGTNAPCEGIIEHSDHAPETTYKRWNSDPTHFNISVCETLFKWRNNTLDLSDGTSLNWSTDDLRSIAILGDTGCRTDKEPNRPDKGAYCGEAWSFSSIADQIANRNPSLVIHVGDYRYRGNDILIHPDTWNNWEKDFFIPAATLMPRALWVMARGNHDTCYEPENKGAGWLLLLSPYSWRISCKKSHPVREQAYALDLPRDLRLVVLDTANVVNVRDGWERDFDAYKTRLETLIKPDDDRSVWVVTHYPAINIEEDEQKPHLLRQRILPLLPGEASAVKAVLSGDIHQLQVLGMVDDVDVPILSKPIQFVVGNGGAELAKGFGLPTLKEDFRGFGLPSREEEFYVEHRCGEKDDFHFRRDFPSGTALGHGSCKHGFVIATRENGGWRFQAVLDGTVSKDFSCLLTKTAPEGDDASESCYFLEGEDYASLHPRAPVLYNLPAKEISGKAVAEIGNVTGIFKMSLDGEFYAIVTDADSKSRVIPLGALYTKGDDYGVLAQRAELSKFRHLTGEESAIKILSDEVTGGTFSVGEK